MFGNCWYSLAGPNMVFLVQGLRNTVENGNRSSRRFGFVYLDNGLSQNLGWEMVIGSPPLPQGPLYIYAENI